MIEATTVGVDIAKSVFEIDEVDTVGEVDIAKLVPRGKVLAFFEKFALPGRCGGVPDITSLGPRANEAGPRRPTDAGKPSKSLRKVR
ncbi:MAG: hypothetical protein ACR2PG_20010 [Hyphomicrobiaceae bacterium]